MPTKTAPTLETVEGLLDEVDEWHERVRKIRRKMNRLRRGSKAYLDLLPDLWVELDGLRLKADVAAHVLDDFEDSLPEDQ